MAECVLAGTPPGTANLRFTPGKAQLLSLGVGQYTARRWVATQVPGPVRQVEFPCRLEPWRMRLPTTGIHVSRALLSLVFAGARHAPFRVRLNPLSGAVDTAGGSGVFDDAGGRT